MHPKDEIIKQQRAWAAATGVGQEGSNYVASVRANLFQSLTPRAVRSFERGDGMELLAKMKALNSSSALAVNFFDYWNDRDASPLLTAMGFSPRPVQIEFDAQFPTGLQGVPPHLDVALNFGTRQIVGVESRYCEWITPKSATGKVFHASYFPNGTSLWRAEGLIACQALAVDLQSGALHFRYLDAAQLLRHALDLATQCPGGFELRYLFFDWRQGDESAAHREEIAKFAELVRPDFTFDWDTYQSLFRKLRKSAGEEHAAYLTYLSQRYFPRVVAPVISA